MKKSAYLLALLTAFAFAGCENIGKSRLYFDQGVDLMMNKGKFVEAQEAFSHALKYDKHNPELYYYLGCSYFNQRKYKEAIAPFEKAVELKSDYADAYLSLGRTYDCLHDNDMSCYYYRLAEKHGRPNMDDLVKYCP